MTDATEGERIFAQPDARSIAVTGMSGADRRAVVGAWKARHDPATWMTVSVPHFNRATTTVSAGEAEEAIINQIVCQMDLARSPKTRFRSLMKRNYALDAVVGVVAAAFVALTIFLVWIAGLLPSQRPAFALCVLAFVAWLACIGLGVFHMARTNLPRRLFSRLRPKAKAKGGDIELAMGPDDSRIERYMGDLVYLLNTNRYDNLVFEGIDTYRDLPLFERLHALGALANEQREGKRAPLRLFYLVGDGVFEDAHERAEFFDVIVPVIPTVDAPDAITQLREGFADIGMVLDAEFLSDLSGFVDDPNVLRDITSETGQYRDVLFGAAPSNPGDNERLVALLTYKALFPRDFEALQNGQGYMSALLKSRSPIIDEMRARNEAREAELIAEQEAAQRDEDAEAATRIQAELDALDREDLECSRKPLCVLLSDIAHPEVVFENPPALQDRDDATAKAVTASPYFPFIRFAILGGWIDATYERFMTNVSSESLASGERELIAAISQGASLDANRALGNPFSIVSHLDADQFALPSARLYALLAHLLAYGPTSKLQALFAGIDHDDDLEWLVGYTESSLFNGSVFGHMEQFLNHPIARILTDDRFDGERKRAFCHRLLAYGRDALASENVRAAVLDFAHSDELFLRVECTGALNIAEGLLFIGYRPSRLETAGCARDLLQYVYDHDLYQPTATVVDNIVASLLETDRALPQGLLVTRIYKLKGSAVRENVEAAPERFVSTLLEDAPGKFSDSPEAVAWILNCDGLPPKRALGYLKALSDDVAITRIASIGSYTYQGMLLDRGLVECTPENILDYFTSAGNIVDEHLAGFLEANPFPESFTMATTEAHLGKESGFLKAVIECGGLSDEKVDEVAMTYRAQFNHFDMEGLSEQRTCMLVRNGVIRTTADNLRFIRQECSAAAKYFARVDIGEYLHLVLPGEDGEPAECGFVRSEAFEVFELSGIADVSKIALLSGFSEPVSMSRAYSHDLNAAIATTHFNVNDLESVNEFYEGGNRKLKRAIAEAVLAHRADLEESGVSLSMELVADIAWRQSDARPDMLAFIASQLTGREEEPSRLEVRTVFERANLDEYMALIDGPTAVIPDSPADDALLAALAEIGMAGKQSGKTDWQGLRRINSKGYSRAK